jgi:hypothetical protein
MGQCISSLETSREPMIQLGEEYFIALSLNSVYP